MNTARNTSSHIWALISDNKAENALKILSDMQDGSVWVQNATAVCWMRLGKPEKASAILLDMVYRKNSVIMRTDSSDVTKLNLATAMLMTGNVEGGSEVLHAVEQNTPMKENLEKAVRAWKKQQPIWSRMAMFLGVYSNNKPVSLDFSPGQIEINVKDAFAR
jgi:predicted Zn-dependent protease